MFVRSLQFPLALGGPPFRGPSTGEGVRRGVAEWGAPLERTDVRDRKRIGELDENSPPSFLTALQWSWKQTNPTNPTDANQETGEPTTADAAISTTSSTHAVTADAESLRELPGSAVASPVSEGTITDPNTSADETLIPLLPRASASPTSIPSTTTATSTTVTSTTVTTNTTTPLPDANPGSLPVAAALDTDGVVVTGASTASHLSTDAVPQTAASVTTDPELPETEIEEVPSLGAEEPPSEGELPHSDLPVDAESADRTPLAVEAPSTTETAAATVERRGRSIVPAGELHTGRSSSVAGGRSSTPVDPPSLIAHEDLAAAEGTHDSSANHEGASDGASEGEGPRSDSSPSPASLEANLFSPLLEQFSGSSTTPKLTLTESVSRALVMALSAAEGEADSGMSFQLEAPGGGEVSIHLRRLDGGLVVQVSVEHRVTLEMLELRSAQIEAHLREAAIDVHNLQFELAADTSANDPSQHHNTPEAPDPTDLVGEHEPHSPPAPPPVRGSRSPDLLFRA